MSKLEELTAAIAKAVPEVAKTCQTCGGEGQNECGNPDHGFSMAIAGVGGRSASESQCPECGYKGFSKRDDCSGKGQILRPITLEDVLRALDATDDSIRRWIAVNVLGEFRLLGKRMQWLLGKPLSEQSEETISFLHSLLVHG